MKLNRRIHRRKTTLVEPETKEQRERKAIAELREFYRDMKAREAKPYYSPPGSKIGS